VVALVRQRAPDRRAGGARAALADIAGRARIAVVTRGAVRLGGIRALAGRRVAGARVVALVLRGAGDGDPRRAAARLARVADRARVTVLARRAVGRRGIGARAGQRVAAIVGARVPIPAVERRPGDTCARRRIAGLDAGAGVAVVALGVDGAAVADPDGAGGGSGARDERTCDRECEREARQTHPPCIAGAGSTTKLNSLLCEGAQRTRRRCKPGATTLP